MIPIIERVEQYLSLREALGSGLSASAVGELRKFAGFAVDQGALHVTTELFLHWKATRPGNAGKANFLS